MLNGCAAETVLRGLTTTIIEGIVHGASAPPRSMNIAA